MSRAACDIVSPAALTYATGRPAITAISGMVEHVRHCGEGGSADLLLIAPATANTLCKIAGGIDDTPVTTFATTAIGRGCLSSSRLRCTSRCTATLGSGGV